MDIRVLRYFIAVAEEESISRAAERLHVTQPTLSRQLKELETELAAKLFNRGNRKIELTEEGQFLYRKAQEIVSMVDKTVANFSAGTEVITGDIYIGAGETKAVQIIAHTATELLQEHPHIRIHLHSGNADDLMEKLDNGVLDFGIVIEPTDKQKYDFLRLGAVDRWGLLLQKNHPLAQKERIEAADLKGVPLLVSRQTTVSSEIAGWMGVDSEHLNLVGSYNLLFNASLMVEQGVGCALCIEGIINTTGDSALCFRPLSPTLEAGLNIIWKKNQVFSNVSKKFLEKLRENILLETEGTDTIP